MRGDSPGVGGGTHTEKSDEKSGTDTQNGVGGMNRGVIIREIFRLANDLQEEADRLDRSQASIGGSQVRRLSERARRLGFEADPNREVPDDLE